MCLLACMLVYHVNIIPGEAEEGNTPPGTGVLDSCGSTCGCWESNLSPLGEQIIAFNYRAILPTPLRFLLWDFCFNVCSEVRIRGRVISF